MFARTMAATKANVVILRGEKLPYSRIIWLGFATGARWPLARGNAGGNNGMHLASIAVAET
jgi:hypothetical protein